MILRRQGIYSTDLTRIRQKVKEGALERLQEARMRKGELLVLPEKEVAKMKKVAIQTWDEIASKTPRNAQAVKIVKDYLKGHEVIE